MVATKAFKKPAYLQGGQVSSPHVRTCVCMYVNQESLQSYDLYSFKV